MIVATPATSMKEIRLNGMRHRWRQSSDGVDLRQLSAVEASGGAASPPVVPVTSSTASCSGLPVPHGPAHSLCMGTKSRETLFGSSVRAAAERAIGPAREPLHELPPQGWIVRRLRQGQAGAASTGVPTRLATRRARSTNSRISSLEEHDTITVGMIAELDR
jgi:hypothetical protein